MTRLRGRLNSDHNTQRGGWIRANQRAWYFQWSDAPGVRRGVDDWVEFTPSQNAAGRPIAVDVVHVNN